ncbi:helix-turn-helix domain-containing protein [Lactonifactor longoviformis]|uniref:AraC family transcriptional regulator n=1 Tax=Lactonifactor longoviformis TaxID=341220 RepID=UPI0036F2F042
MYLENSITNSLHSEDSQLPFSVFFYHTNSSWHWHEFLELIYCLKGVYQIWVNDSCIPCMPGDFVIIDAREPHATKAMEQDSEIMVIQVESNTFSLTFTESMMSRYHHYFDSRPSNFQRKIQITENDVLYHLFGDLKNEFFQKEVAFELSMKADIEKIYVYLLRNCQIRQPKIFGTQLKDLIRLQPVLDFIEVNYRKTIRQKEMAQLIFLSDASFCRLFKRVMGKTFSEYINALRIKEVKRLLLVTNEKIINISTTVGYDNVTYFNKVFLRECGLSPGAYRKNAFSALS